MEYLIPLAYVVMGLIGGCGHWAKKRFIDETTKQSLWEYLKGDFHATKKATFTIITTELTLAAASGGALSLNAIIGAITLGYSADSATNSASDADLVAAAKATVAVFGTPVAQPVVEQPQVILKQDQKIKEIIKNDKDKSVNDLLAGDKSL
jgi:hypothetical protein